MKVIAFNGSPRKEWNTATLLKNALEGAASQGAETELVHLYDLDYSGCTSCYECKRINSKSYGKCALNDDLTPFLDNINDYDAIFLGSPNYIGTISGMAKLFIERLVYPYVTYSKDFPSTLFKDELKIGFIYTMGSQDSWMKAMNYDKVAYDLKGLFEMIFGESEVLIVNDTLMFDDYSKYVSERFDPDAKAKRKKEVFPLDCEKAFKMGLKFSG
ncbi:flavodoxin family protein [uncultured Methanobacterium sp.]|uniref:flavodoxin family protein n=1 Tax=uncultured Methanobacterium sp. TaxID=176306 RepID=UPI002AA7FBE8|nr:flavodoxin family protein [uncultured Methanobacterium sp.]